MDEDLIQCPNYRFNTMLPKTLSSTIVGLTQMKHNILTKITTEKGTE
jgi:hypothetical protein